MQKSFLNRRQGEQMYDEELYRLYQAMKNLVTNIDGNTSPALNANIPMPFGALWLTSQGELKYNDGAGNWTNIFNNHLITTDQLKSAAQPTSAVDRQLWLSSDNTLYFFNAAQNAWMPIKAITSAVEFSKAAFSEFILMNTLKMAGDPIVSGGTTKQQFILPDVDMDRFFIDGKLVTNYDKVSNVALQVLDSATKKTVGESTVNLLVSGLHVNPARLTNITKRLVKVDKTASSQQINIQENDTEFYGFKDSKGTLLRKTGDSSSEYASSGYGIALTQTAITAYDFILGVTYSFDDIKNVGATSKIHLPLGNLNSIYVGTIASALVPDISIFIQGLCFENSTDTYVYNDPYVNFVVPMPDTVDIEVLALPSRQSGVMTSDAGGAYLIASGYTNPLIFVGNLENIDANPSNPDMKITDYRRVNQGTGADDPAGTKFYMTGAVSGMTYSIIEAKDVLVSAGKVTTSQYGPVIPCTAGIFSETDKPIIFVDGLLISGSDITQNIDSSFSVYNMVAGQNYVLLKQNNAGDCTILFDGIMNGTTIPTSSVIDTAMVYVNDQLLCDAKTPVVPSLPTSGINNEIKFMYNGGSDGWNVWYIWSEQTATWSKITDTTLINSLKSTVSGYQTTRRAISILANEGTGAICDASLYLYADSVEQPLVCGNIMINNTDTSYPVAYTHSFKPGTNATSVWLDGIRQYNTTESGGNTIILPEPVVAYNNPIKLFYVVEKIESGEIRACERSKVLGRADMVAGISNAYTSNISLYPGTLRVFVGGYRVPADKYRVLDNYTIMFKDIVDDMVGHETQILIEVRQDYSLRELTLPIEYTGQYTWTENDGLPKTLLNSKDLVMIYINGVAYGKEYIIAENGGALELRLTNLNGIPDSGYVTFEWR